MAARPATSLTRRANQRRDSIIAHFVGPPGACPGNVLAWQRGRQERACGPEGAEADPAIACIYHLLTIRFVLGRMRERVVNRMRGDSSFSNERGSMINQLAERTKDAALSMSPGHLIDKLLDWLDELRGAMALVEIDRLARNEARTRTLFD